MSLSVWTIRGFSGLWPVGTAAVVCSTSVEEAASLLEQRLACQGLPQKIAPEQLVPFALHTPGVCILNNGDY